MMQLDATSFYPTRAERVELARRRYFEEGCLPSGVVSDAVFQSWARSQRLHGDPSGKLAFQPVSASRTHLSLQRNRFLNDAWREELPRLQVVLASTRCGAILTDATGVLLGATCSGRPHETLMPVAHRVGVTLSEEAVGTTAPGIVARTGQAACISGSEHFFEQARHMHCAAAPIYDTSGKLAGILDISSEGSPFSFDAAAVVDVYARAIENRLLITQSREHLVIRMHIDPTLLFSTAVGLIGIDARGEIAWRNAVASRLLGLPPTDSHLALPLAEEALGARVSEVASLPQSGAAMMRLPSGLMVWACAEMHASDGHRRLVNVSPGDARPDTAMASAHALPMPDLVQANAASDPAMVKPDEDDSLEPVSLRESDRQLIESALRECGGNVSKAAKKLNVSRGLIYRRMRGWAGPQ